MSLLSKIKPEESPPPSTFVITGVPGIGKTTLAAALPVPLYIATDPGLRGLEHLPRFQVNRDFTTFPEIRSLLDEAIAMKDLPFKSIVIDTLDALETMIYADVCAEGKGKSIEDFGGGYGKGYTRAREKLEELLSRLSTLNRRGLIIMILSHVQAKPMRQPDGLEFNKWVMKGNEKFNNVLIGWADNVLFANYQMFIVDAKKKTAVMGERLLYTSETAAYTAKNRYGLPESIPLDWPTLAAAIEENSHPALMQRLRDLVATSTLSEPDKAKWLKPIATLSPDQLRRGIEKAITLQPTSTPTPPTTHHQ